MPAHSHRESREKYRRTPLSCVMHRVLTRYCLGAILQLLGTRAVLFDAQLTMCQYDLDGNGPLMKR